LAFHGTSGVRPAKESKVPKPVAFITGASTGIGFEAAKHLRSHGFLVYAGARRTDRMEPLAALGIQVLVLDVTDDDSMRAAVGRVLEERGRIDVLVNNAGYGSYGALEEVDLAEGRRQFEVNVFGLARMTQLVLPAMRLAGRGRIINVSSIGGKFYEPLGSWYHASKFAVEGLSDSLRLELKPHGISVSIIEPASTISEWGSIAAQGLRETSGAGPYASQAQLAAGALASTGRAGTSTQPQVIAAAVLHAATAARPRTRYPVGSGARAILALRRILPDRLFDPVVMLVLKRVAGGHTATTNT
jgi:NAD(P)-dependent dehydrogenase (short-subunit alcohol dehydrogenase family)